MDMAKRSTPYVIGVLVAAAACSALLYVISPGVSAESTKALMLLAVLAIVAETLAFVLPAKARGSIAFIPYLATVAIVSDWTAVLAVAAVKLVMELVQRMS